eukprot:TRINITY_DN18512_c0_g1_i1.p1 TRINITY_DN18512_c0_g1~~TRINITY_DN18512_c0_g1_i1.p1  ORF type:complete len:586 (+),score=139.29 TRINITY_DN18512_c0_g1_i1:135-1892(+)
MMRRGSGARGVRFDAEEYDDDNCSPQDLGVRGADLAADASYGAVSDASVDEKLLADLDKYYPCLSPAQEQHVKRVIHEISRMMEAALQRLGRAYQAEIRSFGAYRFNVMTPQDYLDLCVVIPDDVQMDRALDAAQAELEAYQEIPWIADAPGSGVFRAPGFKFRILEVNVKLLLAHRIPNLPTPQENIVVQKAAGLYAVEATEALLASVPDATLFRQLLRFARFWANQRGVYGHHVNLPSGTTWAVLCAYVCKAKPCTSISKLVFTFLRTLAKWDWQSTVISLEGPFPPPQAGQAMASTSSSGGGGSEHQSTPGPTHMTVLHPVGIDLSTTAHMTPTTVHIFVKELRRAHKLAQLVELHRGHWEDMYGRQNFFQRHRHYLEIDIFAANVTVLERWMSWIEDKLHDLIPTYDEHCKQVASLRPWPEILEFRDTDWPHARAMFFGLHLERQSGAQAGAAATAATVAAANGQAVNNQIAPGAPKPAVKQQSYDLRYPTFTMMERLSEWPEAMAYSKQFELVIRHVKNSDVMEFLEKRKAGVPLQRLKDTTGILNELCDENSENADTPRSSSRGGYGSQASAGAPSVAN